MIMPTHKKLTQLIEELQQSLGHDDQTMAEWLELKSVFALHAILAGKIRFPAHRARHLAGLLDREPGEILRLILMEADPRLLEAIESCLGPLQPTDAEVRIINAIRKVGTSKCQSQDLTPITFDRDSIVTLVVQSR